MENARAGTKPSLLSPVDGVTQVSDGRILEGLPAQHKGAGRPKRFFVGGLLFVTACVAGGTWLASNQGSSDVALANAYGEQTVQAASRPGAQNAVDPASLAVSAPDEKSMPQAALITMDTTNESVAGYSSEMTAEVVAQASLGTQTKPVPIADVGISPQMPSEAGSKPQAGSIEKALAAPGGKDRPQQRPPGSSSHAAGKQPSDQQTAKRKDAKASGGKSTNDNDVVLLSALVAHSSERDAKQKPAGREPLTLKTSSGLTSKQAELSKAGSRNRDAAERKPRETAQGLLQQCRQLGFLEGELCRWRICSGQWESEPACRVQ